jgi:hypothetical protein
VLTTSATAAIRRMLRAHTKSTKPPKWISAATESGTLTASSSCGVNAGRVAGLDAPTRLGSHKSHFRVINDLWVTFIVGR